MALLINVHLVRDLAIHQPSFNLPQKQKALSQYRATQGHCRACYKRWGLSSNDLRECGENYVTHRLPLTKLEGGLLALHDDDTIYWLLHHTRTWHRTATT